MILGGTGKKITFLLEEYGVKQFYELLLQKSFYEIIGEATGGAVVIFI